ncbi:MAG: LEA type 2 family protein [Alphaproteobacteria bacterium]|nr:LEA type 2 family protein [Alphaproteobacteria bacterium]
MTIIRVPRLLFVVLWLPLLAACASAGFNDLQTPYVQLSNITPGENMTFFEQRYDVALRIQNPNNVALPVAGLNYRVVLNDREFARGVSRDQTLILALGEEIVHVTVTSNPLDWLKQIDRLQSNPDLKPSYEVDGVLFLSGAAGRRLPFAQRGTFIPGS